MKKRDVKNMVTRHRDLFYLMLSFLMVLMIFINFFILYSPFVGSFASVVYVLINGNFMGEAFFKEERLRLPLGALLLIAFLGIGGWLFIVFHRLGVVETVTVLSTVSPLSFLMGKLESIKGAFSKKLRERF